MISTHNGLRQTFHSTNQLNAQKPRIRPLTARKMQLFKRNPIQTQDAIFTEDINGITKVDQGVQNSNSSTKYQIRKSSQIPLTTIIPKPMALESDSPTNIQSPNILIKSIDSANNLFGITEKTITKNIPEQLTIQTFENPKEIRPKPLVTNFKDYVSKISAETQQFSQNYMQNTRPRTMADVQRDRLLRTIVGNPVSNSPKNKATPFNISHSKIMSTESLMTKKIEKTEDEKLNDMILENKKGYSHGLFKPTPLMSSEKLTEKVKTKEAFSESMHEILSEKDYNLFEFIENSKTEILRHIEWFSSINSQKKVYLMVAQIQESWLDPFIAKQITFLTEERQKLENELKKVIQEKQEEYFSKSSYVEK